MKTGQKLLTRQSLRRMRAGQRGVVLITGLLLLAVIVVAVVSVLSIGTLDERMAGNARNQTLAFQAAEAVIADAERRLGLRPALGLMPYTAGDPKLKGKDDKLLVWPLKKPLPFKDDCTGGFCSPLANVNPKTVNWNDTTKTLGFAVTTPFPDGTLAAQPRYYVQLLELPQPNGRGQCSGLLRITARGVGQDPNAVVFIQADYRFYLDYTDPVDSTPNC